MHRSSELIRCFALAGLATLAASCHVQPTTRVVSIEPLAPLVDLSASEETKNLARHLDALSRAHVMIAGQQLPVWDDYDSTYWRQPLDDLGPTARDVSLVGFAADEYAARSARDQAAIIDQLEAWAKTEHKIIHVSWYPNNPASPKHGAVDWSTKAGTPWDRTSKVDLQALVDAPSSVEGQRFWRDFDTTATPVLVALARRKIPVVFRPILEANGNWFWWGCGGYAPAETTACVRGYGALYLEIQRRVSAIVHNVLWEFSFAPWSHDGSEKRTTDGLAMRPRRADATNAYDIAGISVYDEAPDGVSELPLLGLASLAEMATVSSRVTLDEVGPQHLEDRTWDPATIVATLHRWNKTAKTPLYPLWARFWFDDEWDDIKGHKNPRYKQLSSFIGPNRNRTGIDWLQTSDHGRFKLAP